MWRRPACQTHSKALDISSATARVAPALLKALALLSDTTFKRYEVDREQVEPYWKWEKKVTFLKETSLSTSLFIYKFFKESFQTTDRRLTGR